MGSRMTTRVWERAGRRTDGIRLRGRRSPALEGLPVALCPAFAIFFLECLLDTLVTVVDALSVSCPCAVGSRTQIRELLA